MDAILAVPDMDCRGCEDDVEAAIRGVMGVLDVEADHQSGRVIVGEHVDIDALVAAVDEACYEPSV